MKRTLHVLVVMLAVVTVTAHAHQARLDVRTSGEMRIVEGSGMNHTFNRGVPMESTQRGPAAAMNKSIAVPLRANVAQRVSFTFTPSRSGTVQLLLRGPYVVDRNDQRIAVRVLWSNLHATGTKLVNPDFSKGFDGWGRFGEAAADATVVDVDWIKPHRSARVWHDASLTQTIQVTEGQPVTITATAGYEDRQTPFDRIYRSADPRPVRVDLADGSERLGRIIDGDETTVTLRTEAGELERIPRTKLPAEVNWRSALYPADWKPGFVGPDGAFLHDFSYAGYRRGEAPIPVIQSPVFDVTQPPYSV
ncbi:MAG TPA: hypothetical protein PKB10_03415, partial [Tepidisphaeraceae bacterium]|nr:hypothetical protein [Tepidisphaeraceae bacterium]